MSRELKPYTVDDLANAVAEFSHARGQHAQLQSALKAKRDAIKSFEEDEAKAAAEVARHEARVIAIAKALK